MNGVVTQIFSAKTVSQGAAFATQREQDQYGVAKLTKGGVISSFVLSIEGRMSPVDSWYIIGTFSELNLDANNSAAMIVPLFPEMRANLTTYVGGGGTLTVRLMQ